MADSKARHVSAGFTAVKTMQSVSKPVKCYNQQLYSKDGVIYMDEEKKSEPKLKFELKIEGECTNFGEFVNMIRAAPQLNNTTSALPVAAESIVESDGRKLFPYEKYLPHGVSLQRFCIDIFDDWKVEKRDMAEVTEYVTRLVVGHIKDKRPDIDTNWISNRCRISIAAIKSKWTNGLIAADTELDQDGVPMKEVARVD